MSFKNRGVVSKNFKEHGSPNIQQPNNKIYVKQHYTSKKKKLEDQSKNNLAQIKLSAINRFFAILVLFVIIINTIVYINQSQIKAHNKLSSLENHIIQLNQKIKSLNNEKNLLIYNIYEYLPGIWKNIYPKKDGWDLQVVYTHSTLHSTFSKNHKIINKYFAYWKVYNNNTIILYDAIREVNNKTVPNKNSFIDIKYLDSHYLIFKYPNNEKIHYRKRVL